MNKTNKKKNNDVSIDEIVKELKEKNISYENLLIYLKKNYELNKEELKEVLLKQNYKFTKEEIKELLIKYYNQRGGLAYFLLFYGILYGLFAILLILNNPNPTLDILFWEFLLIILSYPNLYFGIQMYNSKANPKIVSILRGYLPLGLIILDFYVTYKIILFIPSLIIKTIKKKYDEKK